MSETTNYANNAHYFYDHRVAENAFRNWHAATGRDGLAEFLCSTRISTALIYDIGEIVKVKHNGETFYTQVRAYGHGYNDTVLDRFTYRLPGFGDTTFEAMVYANNREDYRTHIPAELLELAKDQVRAEMAAAAAPRA
jgi:hypothetical protein